MDNLINLGKQAYQAYEDNTKGNQQNFNGQESQQQGDFGIGGGAHLNSPDNRPTNQQAGGIDLQAAANQAEREKGEDSNLFSQALGFLQGKQSAGETDIDEDAVQDAHKQVYEKGNANKLDSSSLGAAAALEAMKKFTGGSSAPKPEAESGGFQSKLIGMAMSEAAKLFDKSGGAASGNKQDAVNSAGATILKLLLKNKVSGAIGGGQSSGVSALLNKFL